MNENKFLLFYERKEKPENTWLNSKTTACDNVKELIAALETALDEDGQNITIFTVTPAAYML